MQNIFQKDTFMENETQTTVDTSAVVNTAPITDGEPAVGSWKYDEATVGTGERPEWFKEKYKSVSDQAKAYTELESRFGGFVGAPDEYTINDGVEYDNTNPLFGKLQEIGKANNMSNDMFNNIVAMYNETQEALYAEAQQAELKELGDGAQNRINSISDWAKANMPGELQDTFLDNLRTADDVKAVEHLISLTKEQRVANPHTIPASTTLTEESLKAMQFELDQYGNRRLSSDKKFREEYDKKMAAFYNN